MKPKILTTLPVYTFGLLRADVIAGVSVAMVALPLSLAIAIASGATPGAGLVTAIVAGFLISMFGGSRVQIGGPTGAFIVVVHGVIAEHGYDGLVLATLMAGVILLLAGFLRGGSLVRYVPEAVINGFTMGIAVIIGASQIKDFLGLSMAEVPAEFLEKLAAMWAARGSLQVSSLFVGAITLISIVVLRRLAPRLPGLIVAVALGSVLAIVWQMPVDTIGSRFGALPDRLPMPQIPAVSMARAIELLPSAFVIAFLAGIESLLSAIVADRMIGSKHRSNAELLAQGIANLGSGLFGGLPATGAIARTATNVQAGGKTPVAGMVHAVTILAIMMIAAPLAGYAAMPALAALLLLVSWNMSEPHKWRSYRSGPVSDQVLLVLTLVLTVLVDLTVAIAVGVAVGMAIRWWLGQGPVRDWSAPKR